MLFKKMDGFIINNKIINVNNDIRKLWKLFMWLWLRILEEFKFKLDSPTSEDSGVNNILTIFK